MYMQQEKLQKIENLSQASNFYFNLVLLDYKFINIFNKLITEVL